MYPLVSADRSGARPRGRKDFYDQLIGMLRVERMEPTRELFADDFCVVEHDCTAVINGDFMGIPRNGRRGVLPHDPRVGVQGRRDEP